MASTVEVSVSHLLRYARNETWVKAAYISEVQPGETPVEAFERVTELVNTEVLRACNETIKSVMGSDNTQEG